MVIPLEDAVRMASEILGVLEKGRIASGADADLVVLSTVGVVEETIVAGESVYHGKGRAPCLLRRASSLRSSLRSV